MSETAVSSGPGFRSAAHGVWEKEAEEPIPLHSSSYDLIRTARLQATKRPP